MDADIFARWDRAKELVGPDVDEPEPLPCPSCGVLMVWGYCRECDAPTPEESPF